MIEGKLLQVSQVKLPVGYTAEDVRKACIRKLKINDNEILAHETKKKSIDARKKDDIHYSLSVVVSLTDKAYSRIISARRPVPDVTLYKEEKLEIKRITKTEL